MSAGSYSSNRGGAGMYGSTPSSDASRMTFERSNGSSIGYSTTPSDSRLMERSGSTRGGYGSTPTATSAPMSRLSSVAVESADVVLDERKMYAVEWRESEKFGFTVVPVNSDRGTVLLLVRRTVSRTQLEAAGLQDIVPGDMLIGIGDEKVYHLGAENAAKYMRSVAKPVRLTLQLSPYGNATKTLPDLAPNEYNYLWEDGPLGIVLTYDLKSKLPMVKRLSDKANDIVRRDVEIGDQLMYANDVPSSEYSMDEVMNLLREMPKPVLLRFRKQLADDHLVELPELAENEYEFLWDYGPLGLVIGMSRAGLPFVRSFTGLGTSRQLPLVLQDDEIVMVNDRSARDEGFREIMQYLMNVPKPAVLRFRRKIRGEDERFSSERSSAQQRGSSTPHDRDSSSSSHSAGHSSLPPQSPNNQQPISPVAPLKVAVPAFSPASSQSGQRPPPSPQVHVAMDRNRFSSVSYGQKSEVRSSVASEDLNRSTTSSMALNSPPRPSGARQTGGSTMFSASHSSYDARASKSNQPTSPDRTTETIPFDEDRETAILPPEPKAKGGAANRGSIFSFGDDDGPRSGSKVSNEPPRERRLSAKTGSMPYIPPVEGESELADDRRAANGSLGRSHSSRPASSGELGRSIGASTTDDRSKAPVNTPTSPRGSVNNQRDHTAKAAPSRRSPKNSPVNERGGFEAASSTPAKKAYIDTADLFADPPAPAPKPTATEPVKKPAPAKSKQAYIDTAELFAEPTPAPEVKKTVTAGNRQYIDTAELFAEPAAKPAPKAPTPAAPAPVKKPFIDTAELFAEPAKPAAPTPAPAPAPVPVPVPAPAPVVAKPAPPAETTTPPPPAAVADGQEFYKLDESAFYTVKWTDGPFGSTVREAESSDGPVMLITKRTGKATCAGLRRIAVGDILVRIGDQSVPSMGFEKATRYLRKVAKPVPLTFQAID